MLASRVISSSPSAARSLTLLAPTRLVELVLGRLLDLVVFSVEGTRERLRPRLSAH